MKRLIVVKAAYDAEASVWYVEESDVPGLATEAATIELLIKKLPGMIADLLEMNSSNGDDGEVCEVPIELIAHASSRVKVGAAA